MFDVGAHETVKKLREAFFDKRQKIGTCHIHLKVRTGGL
jgi:hypothetical protein